MENTRAVVHRHGGPEVIELIREALPPPARGQVQVRVLASGVAFGDVLKRRGGIPGMPKPPFTPGYDLVGRVERCGEGCARTRPGDVVAAYVFNGANAERVNVPEEWLVPVPSEIDPAEAVSLILNYVTAWQLLHRVAKVQRGQRILVHGAAGGVGTALLQLGRLEGLEMFGTASPGKHALVRELGAVPIDYRSEDFVARVWALTRDGVDAVFDPIGGNHLSRSHRTLRRGGTLVSYGASSALELGAREAGLTFLLVGWYKLLPDGRRAAFYGIGDRKTIREDLTRLLALRLEGKLAPIIGARLPLSEARRAHEMLEARAVAGKIVLVGESSARPPGH